MGGFNYGGGKGDGTGWSRERGDGTTPGGDIPKTYYKNSIF